MLGKPKYKEGDTVTFLWEGVTKTGGILIVDPWGTFHDPSDVSYDIVVEDENMLYKHINERYVKRAKKP